MYMVATLFAWLFQLFFVINSEESQCRKLSAVLLTNRTLFAPESTKYRRQQSLIGNFTRDLFKDHQIPFEVISLKEKSRCQTSIDPNIDIPNAAHTTVWGLWSQKHKLCNDILFVFQGDAVIGSPIAGNIMIEYAAKMIEDIMFFGYCFESFGIPKFLTRKRYNKYHPRVTGLAPHCLHAYAVTVAGASKLSTMVDSCGVSADQQIAALARKSLVTFNYMNTSFDSEFLKLEFARSVAKFYYY